MLSAEEAEKAAEEKDYQDFENSIDIIDKEGKTIPPVLEEDDSPDPEGDRE